MVTDTRYNMHVRCKEAVIKMNLVELFSLETYMRNLCSFTQGERRRIKRLYAYEPRFYVHVRLSITNCNVKLWDTAACFAFSSFDSHSWPHTLLATIFLMRPAVAPNSNCRWGCIVFGSRNLSNRTFGSKGLSSALCLSFCLSFLLFLSTLIMLP